MPFIDKMQRRNTTPRSRYGPTSFWHELAQRHRLSNVLRNGTNKGRTLALRTSQSVCKELTGDSKNQVSIEYGQRAGGSVETNPHCGQLRSVEGRSQHRRRRFQHVRRK